MAAPDDKTMEGHSVSEPTEVTMRRIKDILADSGGEDLLMSRADVPQMDTPSEQVDAATLAPVQQAASVATYSAQSGSPTTHAIEPDMEDVADAPSETQAQTGASFAKRMTARLFGG